MGYAISSEYILQHRVLIHIQQKFGLITFILLVVQIVLGGGSVWFNGRLFGGNPKAKLLWKYHR